MIRMTRQWKRRVTVLLEILCTGGARRLANDRGYISLTEAALAAAIGLTLAALAAPMVLTIPADAKLARAKADAQAIRSAITQFFADTTEFPIRSVPGRKTAVPLADGQSAVACLRTGATAGYDPLLAPGKSFDEPGGGGAISCLGTGVGNFLNNHLVFDADPARSLKYRAGDPGTGAPPRNWLGPYIQVLPPDPWGKNYIVLALGMQRGRDAGGSQLYAWVLSAGANGILETGHTDAALQGDDIGVQIAALSP